MMQGVMNDGLNCIISSFVGVFLTHYITIQESPFSLQIKKLAANLLCYSMFIGLFFVLTAQMNVASVIGLGLTTILATINYYLYSFKGTELSATDFGAIGTALNVSKSYHIKLKRPIVISWCIFILFCFIELHFCSSVCRNRLLTHLTALLVEIIWISIFLSVTKNVRGTHWENEGSKNYGFFLNFCLGAKAAFLVKPKFYSTKRINAVAEKYGHDQARNRDDNRKSYPDVIVIMNESFADLRVIGNHLTPSIPVTPFFDALKDKALKGYALASVFGGSTANSEYEFLTGNTMAWFPYGMIPLQQYVRGKTYSVVTEMKKRGYYCLATHPFLASGWSRPTAYPALGFDELEFIEAYPQKDLVRGYVSDQEMYEHIISRYEELAKNGRVFLYGVTIQNHGDYLNRAGQLDNSVKICECPGKYPDAEQYLTLLNMSDRALEKLIEFFESIEREVIICFFGDHLPALNPEFMRELHGGEFESLDEKQETKKVPFFIWNNKGIRSEDLECTSINYLAARILAVAGFRSSPFFRFLSELEDAVPAINADGCFDKNTGHFIRIENSNGRAREMLDDYRSLIYNSAVDLKHRNRTMFPEWE